MNELTYFCVMVSKEIGNLYDYIKEELDHDCNLQVDRDYTKLTCPNLSFDIFIIEKLGANIVDDVKRKVILTAQQLSNQTLKIKNRIKALSGHARRIYARETVMARIDKRTAMTFQEDHHLQIALPGKYRYGLYEGGELVSVAIFSGGRRMKDQGDDYRSFELLRFCHKSDHLVVGGLSKLIRGFIKEFCPNDIMTYVDLDWSQESSLKKIGFTEKGYREAETFWISEGRQFSISNEKDLLEASENQSNGYLYQNSGSIKLVLSVC